MAELFSAEATFARWLNVELLAVEAWASVGAIPDATLDALRAGWPIVDATLVAQVREREHETHHDVAAFVDVLTRDLGDEGRWVHFGLTSSDVVDTAMSVSLVAAGQLIISSLQDLNNRLTDEARTYRSTPIIGRTHGVHAETTTFGARLALLALQVRRSASRVEAAVEHIAVGKLSGPVGVHSNVDPRVEKEVCSKLGLRTMPASQVLPRDLHADFVYSLAMVLTAVETLALQIRLGQQTEVAEIHEGFGRDQKGSSAMPHKENPMTAERLCGLARLGRAQLAPVMEDVALWHERDLSHSSVERVVLPGICALSHYAVQTAAGLVANWSVDADRMLANLAASGDIACSSALIHALVQSGWDRDAAYREVQDAARSVGPGDRPLYAEAVRRGLLPDDQLRQVLDPIRQISGAEEIVDQL